MPFQVPSIRLTMSWSLACFSRWVAFFSTFHHLLAIALEPAIQLGQLGGGQLFQAGGFEFTWGHLLLDPGSFVLRQARGETA